MSDVIQRKKFNGMFTRAPVTKNHPEFAFLAWNMKITGEGIEPVKGFSQFGGDAPSQGQSIIDAFTFTLTSSSVIADNNASPKYLSFGISRSSPEFAV